jgi:hypothetical protein
VSGVVHTFASVFYLSKNGGSKEAKRQISGDIKIYQIPVTQILYLAGSVTNRSVKVSII